jgi:hypothetical protein
VALTERSITELKNQNASHAFLHSATSSYRDGPMTPGELKSIMGHLSSRGDLANENRACVVFGRGSQTRQVYRELANTPGLSVLWQGAVVPWWLLPLAIVAAAQGGLVRVTASDQAGRAMLRLTNLAMVELHSFRADLLEGVVQHVRQNRWRASIGRLVGKDPSYFTLGVDGDNSDCATGIFAWSSYGSECPAELKALVAES